MKPNLYRIQSPSAGFGDHIAGAAVVNILNSNNIKAALWIPHIHHIVDCLKIEDLNINEYEVIPHMLNRPYKLNPNYTFYTDLIEHFKFRNKINFTLDIKTVNPPCVYKEIPSIQKFNVAMVTKTGPWTPYRNWPYFNKLKKLFEKNNISYIDLSEEKVKNFEFLNYVKKSKVYLGLETGASIYAAPFVKDKGFIIQGGYGNFEYWAAHYNYIKIENKMHCAPCWKLRGCEYNHECMTQISAEKVFEKIKENLC